MADCETIVTLSYMTDSESSKMVACYFTQTRGTRINVARCFGLFAGIVK